MDSSYSEAQRPLTHSSGTLLLAHLTELTELHEDKSDFK